MTKSRKITILLSIIVVILISTIAGAMAISYAMQNKSETKVVSLANDIVSSPVSTPISITVSSPALIPAPSPTAITPEVDQSKWKTFSDSSLGIKFKYPDNYSIRKVNGNGTQPTEAIFVQLPTKPYPLPLVMFGHNPDSYGMPNNNPPRDMQPIKIAGTSYNFTHYVTGEGGSGNNCPTGFENHIYQIQPKVVDFPVEIIESNIYGCDQNKKPTALKPTEADMLDARKIVESMEVIK